MNVVSTSLLAVENRPGLQVVGHLPAVASHDLFSVPLHRQRFCLYLHLLMLGCQSD